MQAVGFLSEHRFTGIILVLAFVSFAIGAGLPTVGAKGNIGIYTLPVREYLSAVAGNADVWRWANIFMGAAAVILAVGLTILTTSLEGAGEHLFSRLGLVGVLISATSWLIFSAFRATVPIVAGREMTATGTVSTGAPPPYYEPLAQWTAGLFSIYASVGFLALAAYSLSLLQVEILPSWAGWGTLLFSLAMLGILLVTGDILPILHYLPPLLMGILLLAQG